MKKRQEKTVKKQKRTDKETTQKGQKEKTTKQTNKENAMGKGRYEKEMTQ